MPYLGPIIIRLAGPALAIALIAPVCAQAPFSTNYQAVVRDALGEPLVSTSVTVRFTVRTGSIGGTIAYRETHGLTTNAFGLITAGIGEGSPVVGSYAAVGWSASDHYLQVEVDPGTGYVDLGTARLNSVPYSLHARTTGKALSLADADNDTKVQVEESPDEDIIRFDVAGTERFRMRAGRLEVVNTGGSVFVGDQAGANDDLTNNHNTLIGAGSGDALTSGANNTALGYGSLSSLTTNNANTAIGVNAMEMSTTGTDNTAVGQSSLRLTTASNNTALGASSLVNNSTGTENTGAGRQSLLQNTTGSYNTALGAYASLANTTGFGNTAVGHEALYFNTSGDENVAVGRGALYAATTANRSTAIGVDAMRTSSGGQGNTAVGYQTLYNNASTNNTAVGNSALYTNTAGFKNTAVGVETLELNTTGTNNTAVGFRALEKNTSASNNSAFGSEALWNTTTGIQNAAVGTQALQGNTAGNYNSAVGHGALAGNTIGLRNTAMGHTSLFANTTGGSNTAIGGFALEFNSTASNNTGLGYSANSNAGNFTNSTGVGYDSEPGASNKVQLGNPTVSVIGGYANWSNLSDGRFKSDVRENVAGLDFVLKLRPVTYHLDMEALAAFQGTPRELRLPEAEALKAAELQVGFVAQEVEQAARSIGFDFHGVDRPQHAGAHYGLRYAEFVPPLVKAVQEQQVLIEALQAELAVLKAQVAQRHADPR
ncbi:MAG TPA: tail fiber domain-containing protein [Flavobacteriales bacterium]|nr:tail fiber domain-containing protein [Flavobacteriales bacterium]HMR26441.1 tail fiber domain-containing protein [Flavobacteriales bacterium]